MWLCSYDWIKTEPVIVDSIKHLDNQEQAEATADKFWYRVGLIKKDLCSTGLKANKTNPIV